jgi:rsbT co-antagonist protein RsbR
MPRTLLQKVTLGFITVVLLSIAITGLATVSGLAIRNAFHHLITYGITRVDQSNDFTAHLSRAISEAAFFALTRNPTERMHSETALKEAREVWAALEQPSNQDTPTSVAGFAHMQQRRTALLTTAEQGLTRLLNAVESGDSAVMARTFEGLKDLNDELEQLELDSDAAVEEEVATASDIMQESLWRGLFTIGGSLAILILGVLLGLLLLRRFIMQPISILAHGAHLVAEGSFDQVVPVTSQDEIGSLQQAFNHMVANLRAQHQMLDERRINAEEAHAALAATYRQIEEQLATIQNQRTLLRELSVPVLPLTPTTLVIPLVGTLDNNRLMLLHQQMLQALEQSMAQYVILDLTGVPVVDTQVAQGMIQVTQAARLLGAQTILAGINPAVAQSVVGLGIDVSRITIRRSLQHAITYTLAQDMSEASKTDNHPNAG